MYFLLDKFRVSYPGYVVLIISGKTDILHQLLSEGVSHGSNGWFRYDFSSLQENTLAADITP